MPTTAANEPSLFGFTYSNAGVLQVSRGGSNAVPSPLTKLQSPASPISLAAGLSTNVLDFTGLSLAFGVLSSLDSVLLGTTRAQTFFIWNGSTITLSVTSVSLTATVVGNILTLKNNTLAAQNNVYWTLDFFRIE